MKSFLIGMGLILGTPAVTAKPGPAIVEQPRPFGYVLGDTLVQRVLLRSSDLNFDPASLPPIERAGLWFARRGARMEVAGDGREWLILDYQLVNAPQTLMTVNLPGVSLKPKNGGGELVVPEWPISVAPLTPRAAFAKGGLQELRPDHPPPLLPTLPLKRQFAIGSGAFVSIMLTWMGWWLWRSVRATANQPFARALRKIRRDKDDSDAAWMELHRAFDSTAGRALQISNLAALFQKAPHFAGERAAIERFFAESSQRFFAGSTTPHEGLSVRTLCSVLRRIEKQHER